jgi:hypothetical protein
VAGHVRETRLVTGGARAFVDNAEQLARLVGLVGPDMCTRQRRRRAQVGRGDEAIALRAHRLAQCRAPGTGLHPGVELGRRGERPDTQIGIVGVTQQSERLLGAVACLLHAPRELQAEREYEQAPHARFPVVAAFRDRRPTQRDALVRSHVLVAADEHQRTRMGRAGRQLLGRLSEELEGAARMSRLLVALAGRQEARSVLPDVRGRGEAGRHLAELGRRTGRASPGRLHGGGIECRGHLRRAGDRRGGEVPRALLRVIDDRGEPGVHLPAPARGHGRQRGRREERVTEPRLRPALLEHPGLEGGIEEALVLHGGEDERRLRVCQGCDRRERREGSLRKRREPVADEPSDLWKSELGVRVRRPQAPGLGGSCELQGDEGVPPGHPLDAPDRGPGQAVAELAREDRRQRVETQWTHEHPPLVLGDRRVCARAQGREGAQCAGVQPARYEPQDLLTRPVEPLQVVDREEHRALPRRGAQQRDGARRQRAGGCDVAGLVTSQRGLERSTLRQRQILTRFVERLAEEIGESREGASAVAFERSGDEDAVAELASTLQSCPPDRRLADPGGTLQDQHIGRPVGEEGADRLHLDVPTNELGGSHGVASRRSTSGTRRDADGSSPGRTGRAGTRRTR